MADQPAPCSGSDKQPHEPVAFERLTEVRRARSGRAFIRASEISPTSIKWLWKPYLALGNVTLLGGDGGVGKSTVTARIAATVTKGEAFPNAWRPMAGTPSDVLILNAEDDLAATLTPRLIAAGADRDRVTLVDLEVDDSLAVLDDQTFDTLDHTMCQLRPRLVVVDPIVSFMGGARDMHRANEVRQMLLKLSMLARRHQASLLVVGHLNKNEQMSATNRFAGSADFRNAARSLILAGKIDDEPDRGFALFHNKSNYAALADPLGYVLLQEDETSVVEWQAHTDLSSGEVFEGKEKKIPRTKTAEDVIRAVLNGMPHRTAPSGWVRSVLQAAVPGVSDGTLQKARKAARVEIIRSPDGPTDWRLPGDATTGYKSSEVAPELIEV